MQDFVLAIRQLAAEKGIDVNEVTEAIKHAVRVSFRHEYPEEQGSALDIDIDMEKGGIAVYADKKIVKEVAHPPTQISEEDAKKIEPRLKVGDHMLVEITHTGDFGRVAAQAARQVIMQLIREAEKEALLKQFTDKIGQVETATIQRMDRDGNVMLEIFRAMAKMPAVDQIPTEFYKSGDRIKVLLKEIRTDAKGKILIVSRADPQFLKALFAMEVPEIASGTVEIMEVAREAGSRSKVAVRSNADGVDPIGSCVGQRGSRINAITNELKSNRGEEKIDIIPWSEDIKTFIANSISPAKAVEVKIVDEKDKLALILVSDEDLSLAIGREGQNVRLAARLTGWKLDIQGVNSYNSGSKPTKKPTEPEESSAADKQTDANGENDELNLGTRINKALIAAGINTMSQLRELAAKDGLNDIAGIGPKAVEDIKQALA